MALAACVWCGIAEARTWQIPTDAPTIQAGIDSARAGDDVLLEPGTYTWTSEHATGLSMIRMKAGVWLHSEGGAGVTVLDAESRGRVLACEDTGHLRIEGLTIQNGDAPAPGGAESRGGGICSASNAVPTISRCLFRNNLALNGYNAFGGGIYCDGAVIEDCEFSQNRAGYGGSDGLGGAVFCGAARIDRCVFRGNYTLGDGASSGGAIYSPGSITISDCVFEGNSAGAVLYVNGGAILAYGGSITSCVFRENRTTSTYGYYSRGGAVALAGTGTLSQSTFVRNSAESYYGAAALGGGVLLFGAWMVTDCILIQNAAARYQPDGDGLGGAIYGGGGGTIENCTLLANSGGAASGVGGISMPAGGSVRGVVVAYTPVGQACSGAAVWSCSDLYANVGGDFICGIDGDGNFSADPQFCAQDPAATGNVTIQADSPCAAGNHPNGIMCGLIGSGPVGCGSVSVQERTWSALKSMYR